MRSLAIAALLLPLAPTSALAFGEDGHRIVCEIAEGELSQGAKAELDRLLALDPDFSAFAEACLWADQVRNSTHRETRGWHFLNLEKSDLAVDAGDCHPTNGCVLVGISTHLTLLKNGNDTEKLEALKFVGHWVGDIHQPLHISFFEDRGGNRIDIRWLGQKNTNLHAVWDTEMILSYQRTNWNETASAERWKEFATELIQDISWSDRQAWKSTPPLTWAQESYDITRDPGVLYVDLDETDRHPLGQDYLNRNMPILKERLQQAGIRLGAVLEDALLK